ncbi:MAG: methionine--tRNA ligase [Oscillospiraceae bacterium]
MDNKFYITTAIAYTSRKPHIGNTYEIILTDAIARYNRLKGKDVFFLTGTDEHGQKIEEIAAEAGIKPKEYVDNIAGQIRNIWDLMDSSYDGFIRTTDEQHEKVVQKIFKKLYDQGDIYKGTYEGLYCTPCESFFTGTQLVNGKCPDCGREVQKTSEESYFFKMSKYQDRLMKYIDDNPTFIVPESRKKEMVNNFLKPGLQDLCVSRTSFSWGIPVDFDPKHVVYVWIDALSNYITALGYDPDGSSEMFKKYWPADIHVIGKDILRFHTIYWPIMLMALGLELPKQIFGHPWMLFGKDKMSKSRGNVIYADDLAQQFGVDAVRYYALSEMPYGQDGTITYDTVISRYNSDLANTLGNLVNRTVAMSCKYFDGNVENTGVFDEIDNQFITDCKESKDKFIELMDEIKVADTLEMIMSLARKSNKYIDETTPWTLAKTPENSNRLKQVLFNLIESIRYIAVMLSPFMPSTSTKIFSQIGTDVVSLESLDEFGCNNIKKVGVGSPLFERIDEKKKLEELEQFTKDNTPKVKEAVKDNSKNEVEGIITIDDFSKVELRIGKIIACEKVEKSDKLYCLQIDDGTKVRQIVSGIAAYYTIEELINKKIIFVANLAPVKLRGVCSNGMLLAADCPNKEVRVIFIDDAIEIGSKIR